MAIQILAVAGGGAIGSVLRLLASIAGSRLWQGDFPVATFAINVAGCFLIGLLAGVFGKHASLGPELRAFLMTGFCGGFTTFSAFALENARLIEAGNWLLAGLYACGSAVVGIAATFLGLALVR